MDSSKLRVALVVLMVCLVCATCLTGCQTQGQTYSIFGLGSVINVVDLGANGQLKAYIQQIIEEVQAAVDVTDGTSDLARFNAAADDEPVSVSALTYDMVATARACYDLTGGLYDPTAYWAVDLWGFLPRKEGTSMPYDRTPAADGALPLPDERYIAAFAALADMRKVELLAEDGTYRLVKHGSATVVEGVTYYTRLDLGGIAKGYVIEKIRAYAQAHGIDKGYVSFGSSSLLLLANRKGKAWDLSLTHPRQEGATYCTMPAMDVAVSTSGDYQNYYRVDEVRYCHLLDPRTGRPNASDLMTVTVLGGDACVGDALSTALTVGGLDSLKAFAASAYAVEHGLDFVAVYREGDTYKVYATREVEVHI